MGAGPSILSRVLGAYYAAAYAYGCAGGPAPFRVASTTASGTVTVSTAPQQFSLVDGRTPSTPFGIYAPITIGIGSTQETVLPTAVSFVENAAGGGGYWNITAAFANAHSQGEPIASGSFGVQEAAMDCLANGGGIVIIDSVWTGLGGTLALLVTYKSVGTSVTIVNQFSISGAAFSYKNATAGSVWTVTAVTQY